MSSLKPWPDLCSGSINMYIFTTAHLQTCSPPEGSKSLSHQLAKHLICFMSLFSEGQQAEDAGSRHAWRQPHGKCSQTWKLQTERVWAEQWLCRCRVFRNFKLFSAASSITENPDTFCRYVTASVSWLGFSLLAHTVTSLNPPSAASDSYSFFFVI